MPKTSKRAINYIEMLKEFFYCIEHKNLLIQKLDTEIEPLKLMSSILGGHRNFYEGLNFKTIAADRDRVSPGKCLLSLDGFDEDVLRINSDYLRLDIQEIKDEISAIRSRLRLIREEKKQLGSVMLNLAFNNRLDLNVSGLACEDDFELDALPHVGAIHSAKRLAEEAFNKLYGQASIVKNDDGNYVVVREQKKRAMKP